MVLLLVSAGVVPALAQSDRQFIRQGNRLFRQQNYAKAETEYRKAIDQNSRNSQAIYNLGCALMMQQKDSAAIEQYQLSGKLETDKQRKAKSYHNIGVVCQNHQLYDEAIKAYQEALRNNPADNETRYNLALCKHMQKKNKQNKNDQNNEKKNDKNEKQDKDKQKKNQENKDKQQQQNKNQQQKPEEKMSKENAEQLLNAAMQEEKATQQRLKKAMQQPRRRQLQKNW